MNKYDFINLIVESYEHGYKYIIFVDGAYNIYEFKLNDLNFEDMDNMRITFDYELKHDHYRFIK